MPAKRKQQKKQITYFQSQSQKQSTGRKALLFGSKRYAAISVLLIVLTGVAFFGVLQQTKSSKAAWPYETSPSTIVEGESMSRPSGATVVSDSSASAGKSLRFSRNGSSSKTFSANKDAAYVEITAKGVYCRSGWPRMTIALDGVTIASNISVNSTSWKAFGYQKNVAKGSHTLKITMSNASSSCNRYLYVDVAELYSLPSVTPAPTVSISASPQTVASGAQSTISWTSTNATSCSASGAWSGSVATSGTYATPSLTADSTYTLTCSGPGGSTTSAVLVTIQNNVRSIYWGSWIDADTYGGDAAGRGDAPWDAVTWNTFEANAGKKVSILHYGQPPMWEQQFYPNVANLITDRGAIPFIDMSSSDAKLTDVANGVYDQSIISWADSVKAWGKPFFYRWNWEMNGTWFPWGSQAAQNPANFVAAWRHIHDVVNSRGATNVTWVWCPNIVYSGSTSLSQLYPGNSYVDWTCIDGYNWGNSGGRNDPWLSFSQIMKPTYDQLLQIAPSKPIMIGETASNEGGGSKSAWITDAFSIQLPNNFPQVKAVVWFNWPTQEDGATQQWPIESSSASQAAFRQAIGSTYYASNNYGTLPLLSKVAPIQ